MAGSFAVADDLRRAAGWVGAQARAARRAAEAALGRDHLRIGVTGLSGAGKTVFTTSLIHALCHGGAHPATLPLFADALGASGWSARIEALPGLPPFPYAENLAGLVADPPAWPAPTRASCGLRLILGTEAAPPRQVTLDIVDYPGEWLLDLDMLELDYAAWSARVLARLQASGGLAAEASGAWLGQALAVAGDGAAAGTVVEAYGAMLMRLRGAGLLHLAPGRLLVPPADAATAPPSPAPLPAALAGQALYATMAARYAAYRDGVVLPFHRLHVAPLDRQIVLFDVIGALGRGPAALADARGALLAALEAFRYRRVPLLDLLRARIDRVLVVATKIDHVTTGQYLNARALIEEIFTGTDWAMARGRLRFDVLAAIRATEDGWIRRDGAQRAALRGVLAGDGGVRRTLVPSDVPPAAPRAEDWPPGGFVHADFAPPDLSGHRARPFPSVNLDKALDHLVGDRLR
jgi:predicted YcjX-like family ATPase